ncbi:hypothetical protein GAP86_18655 [Salmonella enterica]|nr:hypothetical protein [Salmonella enterica subsp. enterica serovar Kedougou]EDC4983436.1 hypothetical protein [Salmonella enterica]EGH2802970.1 hypothetical protein [Salmonella enterica]EGN9442013.1 hypothetical protein [Salmonella enterica]
MLVVYSETMTTAPRHLQRRFLESAYQEWGFRAPYSDEFSHLEFLALEISVRTLWETIALFNARCDPHVDYLSLCRKHDDQNLGTLERECLGYIEKSTLLKQDFNNVCLRLWNELESYPGEIVWYNNTTCSLEICSGKPVRLASFASSDLSLLQYVYPEDIKVTNITNGGWPTIYQQGDAWILAKDLDRYLLLSDQIHSGYDAYVKEYIIDPNFTRKFSR